MHNKTGTHDAPTRVVLHATSACCGADHKPRLDKGALFVATTLVTLAAVVTGYQFVRPTARQEGSDNVASVVVYVQDPTLLERSVLALPVLVTAVGVAALFLGFYRAGMLQRPCRNASILAEHRRHFSKGLHRSLNLSFLGLALMWAVDYSPIMGDAKFGGFAELWVTCTIVGIGVAVFFDRTMKVAAQSGERLEQSI